MKSDTYMLSEGRLAQMARANSKRPRITREQIDKAIKQFIAGGGLIQKLPEDPAIDPTDLLGYFERNIPPEPDWEEQRRTAGAHERQQPWSREEIQRLRELRRQPLTYEQIGEIMGRSKWSIGYMAYRIDHDGPRRR